jgi:hypothetical protein
MKKISVLAKLAINYCWGGIRVVELILLSKIRTSSVPVGSVIVSMTSFPKRIKHAWISIESILQQDAEIKRIVLILSVKEFPSKKLPSSITSRLSRGLEIIWVPDNIKSYKKLLSIPLFPGIPIITVDDDIIYGKSCISTLLNIAKEKPTSIIGHRGYVVGSHENQSTSPYKTWNPISTLAEGDNIFLTGSGAIYYPPSIFSRPIELNLSLAFSLCPTADDVWMWAFSNHYKINRVCTGEALFVNSPPQLLSPRLWAVNRKDSGNDIAIKIANSLLGNHPF